MKTCPINCKLCFEDNCPWWNDSKEECCIKTLAINFEYFTEVLDGSKTLYVREV